jgi:hypothetical protein
MRGTTTRNDDLGKCPLCGKPCRWDEEIVQMHAGTDGFVHLGCVQQHVEAALDADGIREAR